MRYEPIFCACGAQWHGKYTVTAQDVIHAHLTQRCFKHCGRVTHQQFRGMFNCACKECIHRRAKERASL